MVQFAARPEASIVTAEKWIAAQVSINKVTGDNRWLLVQEKSDTGAKILYSAMISKIVKLALEEDSKTIVLWHPRTTPKEVNEYKLKFETRFDFWTFLSIYTTALRQGDTVTAVQDGSSNAANDAMSVLTEALAQTAPTGPVGLGQQGGGSGMVGQEGMAEQMFNEQDFYALFSGQ